MAGADAAVLVTEWPELARARLGGGGEARCADALLIDGRNMLDPAMLRAAGFTVDGHRTRDRNGRG